MDEDFMKLLENLDYIFKHFGMQQPSILFEFMEPVDFSAKVRPPQSATPIPPD